MTKLITIFKDLDMKKIVLICLTVVAFMACKKEGFTTYIGDSEIYFNYRIYNATHEHTYVIDSLRFAFSKAVIFKDIDDSLLRIPVRCTGKAVDYDRYFKVVVDEGWELVNKTDGNIMAYAAVENEDYEILYDELVIPANTFTGNVMIKILKPEDVIKTYVIKLGLIPSEDFVTNYTKVSLDGSTTKKVSVIDFKVYFNNSRSQPLAWTQTISNNYYGKYSYTKLDLLLELTPEIPVYFWYIKEYKLAFPDDPDIQAIGDTAIPSPYSLVYCNTVGRMLKNELLKRKEENGGVGLKDEDNDEMFAGQYV